MSALSTSNSISFSLATQTTKNTKQLHKFLKFQLGEKSEPTDPNSGDAALVRAELVTEVINVASNDILPVPHLFYCILGTYSWRSEMLWIVDLENLLGYPPLLSSKDARDLLVMVVEFQGQTIGFVVSKIDGLFEYDLEQFKHPSNELFSKDILPFLKGYHTNSNNQISMFVDCQAIFKFFALKTEFNYSV